MLKIIKKLLTQSTFLNCSTINFCEAVILQKKHIPSSYPFTMSDMKNFKRTRYDGRSKKRQWEERRSDKGEGIGISSDPKQAKTERKITDRIVDQASVEKIKRRKFCLLMGYSGVDYYGMQRNPDTKTIEEELFKALLKVELINEECYNQVQNMQFQRAARTDKGVSAARQVVSLKLAENIDLSKINNELPEQIHVFAYKRVTKGFNSKSQCDSRTYTYTLPTISFSEHTKDIDQKSFRLDEQTFNNVNEILQNFVGTKNFHNYTSKKKPNDPSANRYIKSFVCEKPFVRKGVEFAVLKVHGQSFMMHQIRKMVGCMLAVVKGLTSEQTLKDSFKLEKVGIPRAPGLGLVLDYVHYDRYNYRYGEDGMHEKLVWDDVEEKLNDFREKYIYPAIIDAEVNDEEMLNWIQKKLSGHSYEYKEHESDDEEVEEIKKKVSENYKCKNDNDKCKNFDSNKEKTKDEDVETLNTNSSNV